MAKNIKIGIKLPSNNQLKAEIQSAIKLMEKYSTLDFKIDTKEFSKSLSSMSNELNKLKTQLSKFNVLENITTDTTKISKTKNEIKELNNELTKINSGKLASNTISVDKNGISEINKYKDSISQTTTEIIKNGEITRQTVTENIAQFEKMKDQLQSKLNTSSSNSLIDNSVISKLQSQLDSINTNTSEKEIDELKAAINNLSSSDSSIVRVQNAIVKLQERITTIKKNNVDIIDSKDIRELQLAESELLKLKDILNSLKTGEVIDGNAISNQINMATSSVRSLEKEFKSADNTASGLSSTMKNIFSYALGGSAFYSAMNAMRSAVDTTIELDTAMRDLKRVTDETQSTYSQFTKTANQTAIELGTTTAGAIEATTTFSQLGYSFTQASEELSKYALILSNVGDMSAQDASSAIVSVLKGFQLEASETSRIIDVLNEAGNRFALSTNSMAEGLRVGAADLSIAGNDLEQASAMIIAGTEVLQDSNVVSTGLKTIGMRLRGISQDGEELNAKLGELVKTLTGVDLTDANGEFRSTYDILVDISKVFNTLNSQEQALLLEEVAGKNRANVLAAIFQNAEALTEAYDTLKDSSGSALAEQEAYMDSLSGKINALKESLSGLSIQMVNSDFLKGTIDTMTTGVNVIGTFIDTLGAMPTAITGTVGALTVFNSKFRESTQMIASIIPQLNNVFNKLDGLGSKFSGQIDIYKKQIDGLKNLTLEYQKAGLSTKTFGVNLATLNGKLALTTAKLVATKVAAVALNTALSMGVSLLASWAISGIINSFTSVEERIEATNEKAKELSDTLSNFQDNEVDLSRYEEIKKRLDETNVSEEERKELNEELEEVKSRLSTMDDEAKTILDNTNLSYKEQLQLLKQINEQKVKEMATDLDKSLGNGFWGQDEEKNAKQAAESLNIQMSMYKEAQEKLKNASSDTITLSNGVTIAVKDQEKYLNSLKDSMNENVLTVQRYNSNVELIKKANINSSRSTVELSDDVRDFTLNLNESTEALEENANAKDRNANAGSGGNTIETISIEEATKAYGEAISKTKEYQTILDEINEAQSLTPEIIMELAEKYPQLGSRITDVTAVQQFLNDKISESVEAQAQAYNQMIANDEVYYNSKVANNNALQDNFNQLLSAFVTESGEAYEADLNNYSSLAELKSDLTNQFGETVAELITNFVSAQADGYDVDLDNTVSWASSKAKILRDLDAQITKIESRMAQHLTNIVNSSGINDSDSLIDEKLYINAQKQLADLETQKAEIQTEFSKYSAGFRGYTPTFSGASFDSGTGSSNKGSSSSSSSTEKQVADIEDLTDRYYELENAITDYSNALSLNKLLQDNADDKEKINLMKQEIELYKKQADAVKNLNDEQKKEAEELKKYLAANSYQFDSEGNITNRNQILAQRVAKANSLSGDAKESYKNYIEEQEEYIERYTQLIKNEIPKQEQEWQSLQNSISDVNDAIKELYQDQLDLVASQEKEIADMIEYYANKKVEAKKEAVEKELELEKKRLEGLKKSLSEEKELYNKQIEEEDYEADLAKERNKLAEIQAEIDRLSMDNSAKAKAQLSSLLKQYDEQQQVISEKIKEHQQQATNDRFDQEMELLDKELEDTEDKFDKILEQIDKDLEEYLNPENLNNIIQGAIKTGMVDIMGVTVDVQSAMNDMIKDTEVGFINAATQIGNFIESLKEVKDLYGSINTIMTGSGLTANLPQNIGSRSVQVSVGDLIVQGNIDSDVLSDIQAMMDRQANEIYKNIANQLGVK